MHIFSARFARNYSIYYLTNQLKTARMNCAVFFAQTHKKYIFLIKIK